MATISEMVEQEAAAAEAEDEQAEDEQLAEEEYETTISPADEPPADAAPFDHQAFEREQSRHEKAVRKIMGDGFGAMEPCASCGSVGFVPQGFEPEPELQADPDVVVCDACKGIGARKTGSYAPGYEVRPCSVCVGTGFRERSQIEAAERAAAYQARPQYAQPPTPPTWDAARGVWVTTDGNPAHFSNPGTNPSVS